MIEVSTSHDARCMCHEVKQEILCKSLPKVMAAMKPEDEITIEFHNKFTTSLLEIMENCRQDKKPIYPCVLEALSKMMPLLSRDGLRRYAYILIFHFDSILRAEKSDDLLLSLTIGSVGDFFFTLKIDSLPYLDAMAKLLLNRKEMTVAIRSQCVAALGKIASAIGDQRFVPYLPSTVKLLQESSDLVTPSDWTVILSFLF